MRGSRGTTMAAACLAVVALAVAGCGGDDGADDADAADGRPSTTEEASTTEETTASTTRPARTTTTSTTTAPPTTVPTTTAPSLEGEGEEPFVALAQQLGVSLPRDSLVALGTAACEFAGQGAEVFTSYVATVVEPSLTFPGAKGEYSLLLGAAGIKLCPDAIAVLQPEVERLAGQ